MIWRRSVLQAALGVSIAGSALGQGRQARVGIALADSTLSYLSVFSERMATLGWRESVNLVTIVADAQGEPAALPTLVDRLVASNPDAIVSSSNRTHIALRDRTTVIPVVAVGSVDPTVIGLSTSLARPSRNFTGMIGFIEELMGKRVELLKEALPDARRIALMLDPGNPAFPATHEATLATATRLGVSVFVAGYRNAGEVMPALDRAKAEGVDAVIVVPDVIALPRIDAIARKAEELRLPTLGFNEGDLKLGLTFVLGLDRSLLWRDSADIVDRILRGTPVANVPFQRPTKTYLGINLEAMRRLAMSVSPSLLAQADEVIEQ